MATICPTVTAETPHAFRSQMERIEPFAQRVHIDLADGVFAPSKLVNPSQVWWPETMLIDIHLMYRSPRSTVERLVRLRPSLVIVHAEAEGNFIDLADLLRSEHIRVGIALLPQTPFQTIVPALDYIDHVLIFSGKLGYFGGQADLTMIKKASQVKQKKASIEIGWDGGIDDANIQKLANAGVDVMNVGGYIQRSEKPKAAYARLMTLVEANTHDQ